MPEIPPDRRVITCLADGRGRGFNDRRFRLKQLRCSLAAMYKIKKENTDLARSEFLPKKTQNPKYQAADGTETGAKLF